MNRRIDEQMQSAGNDTPPLSDASTNPSVPSNPFHFPFSLTTPLLIQVETMKNGYAVFANKIKDKIS
jgi:hypothetical protein